MHCIINHPALYSGMQIVRRSVIGRAVCSATAQMMYVAVEDAVKRKGVMRKEVMRKGFDSPPSIN